MITQQEIGKRIAMLRKNKGYSQDELAKMLKMNRPSLAQIELGNRNITANELLSLSITLEFSIDSILSQNFQLPTEEISSAKIEEEENKVRISVPKLKIDKFKNVLLYILERCAGKPNVGETVLYKLLYFSEFNYYELYEEHMVGTTFKKLPYGPVPQKLDMILKQMEENNTLQMVKTEYHGFPQKRYIPLTKPDLTLLKASEKEVIDQVINQLSDFSGKAISDYSHKDIPWRATDDGDIIDYELAFYREAPFSVRNYDNEEDS